MQLATHGHWHLALYDRRVRSGHSTEIADLIDAAALLWLRAIARLRRPLERGPPERQVCIA